MIGFHKKTNELFNTEFKGFEFTLDDKDITYSPGDAAELKKAQNDSNEIFIINTWMNQGFN